MFLLITPGNDEATEYATLAAATNAAVAAHIAANKLRRDFMMRWAPVGSGISEWISHAGNYRVVRVA